MKKEKQAMFIEKQSRYRLKMWNTIDPIKFIKAKCKVKIVYYKRTTI